MKRFLYSLVAGFILPIGYFLLLAVVEGRLPVSSRKPLQLPLAWPRLIYFQIYPPDPNSLAYDTFDPYLFVFIIVCNLVAYTLIVYLVLVAAAAMKRR